MPTNKPRVSFVIPEEIKKELEEMAESDGRSVSNFVLMLIRRKIEEGKQK